jgi:hypothetical protein
LAQKSLPNCLVASITRSDADAFGQIHHKDFAVTNLTGLLSQRLKSAYPYVVGKSQKACQVHECGFKSLLKNTLGKKSAELTPQLMRHLCRFFAQAYKNVSSPYNAPTKAWFSTSARNTACYMP